MTQTVRQLLSYNATPIHEIHDKTLEEAGVQLLIKREDLNHPYISGNKWWKLKYNLEEATRQKKKLLLTFGGAYSNHIYATAAAAYELDFKSIGIIRGEQTLPLNSTLNFALDKGMVIEYISRERYRKKNETEFISHLQNQFGDFYLIPEGGSNELAVKGCHEFAESHINIDFDYICLAVGTGATIAGIISGLKNDKQIIGFSVLKGGDFLKNDVENFLKKSSNKVFTNWHLDSSYHHGGYAKTSTALLNFIESMRQQHNLPLDHVYTGKLLWAVMDYIKKGFFKRGSTVLALHSGGLQGGLA